MAKHTFVDHTIPNHNLQNTIMTAASMLLRPVDDKEDREGSILDWLFYRSRTISWYTEYVFNLLSGSTTLIENKVIFFLDFQCIQIFRYSGIPTIQELSSLQVFRYPHNHVLHTVSWTWSQCCQVSKDQESRWPPPMCSITALTPWTCSHTEYRIVNTVNTGSGNTVNTWITRQYTTVNSVTPIQYLGLNLGLTYRPLHLVLPTLPTLTPALNHCKTMH